MCRGYSEGDDMKVPIGGLTAIGSALFATSQDYWARLGYWGSAFLIMALITFWICAPSPDINPKGE